MRSYQVNISNDKSWISTGQISRTFLVFAEDMTGALMDATEQFDFLRTALLAEGCPEDNANSIRITGISEQSEICGKTALMTLSHSEHDKLTPQSWAQKTALKIKADR